MVDGHNQIQQCFSIILCPNAQLCNSPDLHNLGLILTVGKESNPADYISYIPGPSWVDAMKKKKSFSLMTMVKSIWSLGKLVSIAIRNSKYWCYSSIDISWNTTDQMKPDANIYSMCICVCKWMKDLSQNHRGWNAGELFCVAQFSLCFAQFGLVLASLPWNTCW